MKFVGRFAYLNFLLLGALLYAGAWMVRPEPPLPALPQPDAAQIEALRATWLRNTYALPSEAEMEVLIKDWVDRELLFREALRLKLHLTDTLVWRRLIRNLQFVGMEGSDTSLLQHALRMGMHEMDQVVRRRMLQTMEDRARARLANVPEELLRTRYEERRALEFVRERRAFSHVFFSYDKRGRDGARADALDFACAGPLADNTAGDVYPLGRRVTPLLTENQIAKNFGVAFAQELMQLSPDGCHGPINSAYGVHWVHVHDHRLDPISYKEVRPLLEEDWLRQQTVRALRAEAQQLRAQYQSS